MNLELNQVKITLTSLTFILCLALTFEGCGDEDFDPASLLSGYRLIALQADPPVISATQESIVRIFDYHPDDLTGQRPAFKYEWSVCPFTLGSPVQYQCFVDEIQLEEDGPEAVVSPLELLMKLGDLDQLENSSDQLSDEMTQFDEGKIDLYVKVKTKQAQEVIFESVKRVTLNFLATDADNSTNPSVSEFKVRLEKKEGEDEGAETQDTEFNTKDILTFELSLDEMIDQEKASQWVYTWYSTAGKLDRPTLFGDDEELQTSFTLPEDPGPFRIYLTVRDDQGGVNLMYRDFNAVESTD